MLALRHRDGDSAGRVDQVQRHRLAEHCELPQQFRRQLQREPELPSTRDDSLLGQRSHLVRPHDAQHPGLPATGDPLADDDRRRLQPAQCPTAPTLTGFHRQRPSHAGQACRRNRDRQSGLQQRSAGRGGPAEEVGRRHRCHCLYSARTDRHRLSAPDRHRQPVHRDRQLRPLRPVRQHCRLSRLPAGLLG